MSDTAVKSRCTSFFCLVTVKDRIYHHGLLHLSHKNLKHYHSKQKSRKPRYHPWPPTHCAYTTLSLHPNQLLSPAYLFPAFPGWFSYWFPSVHGLTVSFLFLCYCLSFSFPCILNCCTCFNASSWHSFSALIFLCYLLFSSLLHTFFFQAAKALQIRQYMILHIRQIFHILLIFFIAFSLLIADLAFIRQLHFILHL